MATFQSDAHSKRFVTVLFLQTAFAHPQVYECKTAKKVINTERTFNTSAKCFDYWVNCLQTRRDGLPNSRPTAFGWRWVIFNVGLLLGFPNEHRDVNVANGNGSVAWLLRINRMFMTRIVAPFLCGSWAQVNVAFKDCFKAALALRDRLRTAVWKIRHHVTYIPFIRHAICSHRSTQYRHT